MAIDTIRHPGHYEVYPVQPKEITRYLGFPLGNMVKYVLRAPYKDGVEDCDKALEYLRWLQIEPQPQLSHQSYDRCQNSIAELCAYFRDSPGDTLWQDISSWQTHFLWRVYDYLQARDCNGLGENAIFGMREALRELSRILALRDTTGQIYEGMSGLPIRETAHE